MGWSGGEPAAPSPAHNTHLNLVDVPGGDLLPKPFASSRGPNPQASPPLAIKQGDAPPATIPVCTRLGLCKAALALQHTGQLDSGVLRGVGSGSHASSAYLERQLEGDLGAVGWQWRRAGRPPQPAGRPDSCQLLLVHTGQWFRSTVHPLAPLGVLTLVSRRCQLQTHRQTSQGGAISASVWLQAAFQQHYLQQASAAARRGQTLAKTPQLRRATAE